MVGNVSNASAQTGPPCPLPPDIAHSSVTFRAYFNNGAYCTPRNNSYFNVQVQGGAQYIAWCSDSVADIKVSPLPGMCPVPPDHPYTTTATYDSLLLSCPQPHPPGISSSLLH